MKKDLLFPLRRLHGMLYERNEARKKADRLGDELAKADRTTVFFVLSPTHGNMGDHAIAKAVTDMLGALSIDYKEVTTSDLSFLKRYRRMGTMDGHVILVNGGGNLGTLWPDVEALFRNIIQRNPHSPILCLPNTFYYEDSAYGREELKQSQEIYNAHPMLTLCARERISYEAMLPLYRKVILVPDMVLSINACMAGIYRKGCMICLRRDREKTITEAQQERLQEQLLRLFGSDIRWSDMNIDKSVPVSFRTTALEEKLNEFRSAELVVTDRLHGMIFAAITGTPCIVINSKSPKVRGCYEWIKNLDYIRFADNIEQLEDLYRQIPSGPHRYDNSHLLPYYEELKDLILETVRRS